MLRDSMNGFDSFQWSTTRSQTLSLMPHSYRFTYIEHFLLFLENLISGSTLEDYMHVKNFKSLACECAARSD